MRLCLRYVFAVVMWSGTGCANKGPNVGSDTEAVSDTDDNDASIHPGATDLPGDSVDQDCDGTLAVDCSAATSFAPPGGVTWPQDDDICDPSTPYNLQGTLVVVDNNYGFTSLHGLERLETIGLMLRLKGNDELVDLSGLNGLTKVRDSVELEFNDDLRSLHGLENLERIGGALTLTGNVPLVDFTGLGNLSSVGSYVYVDSNASLERFVGLEGIGHCCRSQPIHSPSNQPVWGELLEQLLKQTMRRSQERRTLSLC